MFSEHPREELSRLELGQNRAERVVSKLEDLLG